MFIDVLVNVDGAGRPSSIFFVENIRVGPGYKGAAAITSASEGPTNLGSLADERPTPPEFNCWRFFFCQSDTVCFSRELDATDAEEYSSKNGQTKKAPDPQRSGVISHC
jgi:hypothetical protein